MTEYNKLVRDLIPEIIESNGISCEYHSLTKEQFDEQLYIKLREELDEYGESRDPAELADLLEVIYAIADLRGITPEQLEQVRTEKRSKHGGFNSRLFLVQTKD